MKLAHITMHYFPVVGGQETYIQSLNKCLSSAGIELTVIQPSRPKTLLKPDYVQYLPRLRFFGRFERYIRGLDWFWFNLMLVLNKRLLRKQDILVSHYPIHYPSISWHKKVIVVSHGVDWREPPTIFLDKYKKRAALIAKRNGVIIVANDTCFLRSLGIDIEPGVRYFEEITKNIWFVPNCIDFNKFISENKQRENIILVPRNIRRSRGIHLSIEAFELFNRRNKGFRMEIVGGHLQGDYYEYCLRLVKKYSLEESVHFAGHVPNDIIVKFYRKAMVTLIPTIDFEGTSISALESMACKTPVVSTCIGGLQDLPAHKVGLSPQEVSDGLESVINSWSIESERQFETASNIFDVENWKSTWIRIIESYVKSE